MLALFDNEKNQEMFARSERKEERDILKRLKDILISKGRADDVLRMLDDDEYFEKLCEEFKLKTV